MKVLTAQSYYAALKRAIPGAKKRIVIQAMVVLWGGRTEALLPLVEAALKRGVAVTIVGDIFSKYEAKTAKIAKRGPHLNWNETKDMNARLAVQGAHITYVGKLGLNPFRGRTHSKITIVDDIVWTFGGVNLSDSHFAYQDLMLEMTDARLADRLATLVSDIQKGQPLSDFSYKLDAQSRLLFDSGTPKTSIIYDTACEMLTGAKKAYFVSKMCPSGRLAGALKRTAYQCYFNRPELEGPPENMAIRFDQRRWGITNSYRGQAHIHAKLILTEGVDGSRQLITGSNNFSRRGITFGTKEIAVYSKDSTLWQSLYNFMKHEIMT